MLLNCLGEYFWESFGLQRDQILKEINQEYSLAGLLLKLMFQYFGHLKGRTDSLENTLMLEKIDGRRREDRGWDGWMASPTQWTWVWANSRRWWKTGRTGMLQSMGSQRVGHHWVTKHSTAQHWCWERLKTGGEGDDRGQDGWMASPIQQICIWAVSRRWWKTGKPDMLQSIGSQRVRQDSG